MEKRNIVRNQKGFTLIEIIAVLVILGVLAAVAVPKYMDLTTEAQAKAVEGAWAAGFSNATLAYSKFILVNSVEPTSIASEAWSGTGAGAPTVAIETDLGDYAATYSYVDTTKTVTVGVTGPGVTTAVTKTFKLP